MQYGFIIPVYNHGSTLETVVMQLLPYDFPIIVIDDGNDLKNKKLINGVVSKYSKVVLVSLKKNGGKGKALKEGIKKAYDIGLTHVFQIDSDGQHDTSRIKYFLEKSQENLDSVICGYPEYDKDAPERRVKGRNVANAWIHIVTLSDKIKDGMIGFRIYPVLPYYKLIKKHAFMDNRMGCDIEILVRLSWVGVNIISESVKINYPIDGISNFRIIRDNIRISFMYARLCLGMFLRLPMLLLRKVRRGN